MIYLKTLLVNFSIVLLSRHCVLSKLLVKLVIDLTFMYVDPAYVTKQVSLVDKPAPRDFEQAALKKGPDN